MSKVKDYVETLRDLKQAVAEETWGNDAIRHAMYHADAIIFIKDWRGQNGKYVAVSKRWEQFFNRSFSVVKDLTDYDIMHPVDADKRVLMEKTALETGRTQVYQLPPQARMLRHDALKMKLTPYRVNSSDPNFIVGLCLPDYIDV